MSTWRQLIPLDASPAPMMILQLGLYFTGLMLFVAWAIRQRRHGLACAFGICALMPICIAEMGTIIKDSLMAGALLASAGLLAVSHGHARNWPRWIAAALVLFAATLRFNAFLAGLPLLLALLPRSFRSTPFRAATAGFVALLALLSAMPAANAIIGADRSGVEISLIAFDLGGITKHSGVDAFPPVGIANAVAVNRRCYSPVKWDPYSWWVDEPCPISFARIREAFRDRGIDPEIYWARQIAAHPLAYAEHRFQHWNINARFLVPDEIERPVQVEAPPNQWNFGTTRTPLLSAIDGAALFTARTPLGWPCFWMALALGILLVSNRLPSRAIAAPLATSALLYGTGYLVFSVAAELRYYLWTIIAAALAFVLAASDLRSAGDGRHPRHWLLMLGPALSIAALCCAARVLN